MHFQITRCCHIPTLTPLYASYTNWLRAKEMADGERDPDSSPDRLHTSAGNELAHAVHDLTLGPLKPGQKKKLAEQVRQWEFCGGREVMKAYVAYEEIDKRTDIDEIDKIWEAAKSPTAPPRRWNPQTPVCQSHTETHCAESKCANPRSRGKPPATAGLQPDLRPFAQSRKKYTDTRSSRKPN